VILYALCFILALLPVVLFLLTLVTLDSYKLVRFRIVVLLVGLGAVAALSCLFINPALEVALGLSFDDYSRYLAPFVEELVKGAVIITAISRRQIGFLVDAAVWGFAVGTGFAAVENVHYFLVVAEPNPTLWAIRGFGTAVMHGGATGILAVVCKLFTDSRNSVAPYLFLPGYLAAAAIHGLYNQFFLSPSDSTLIVLIVVPLIFVLTFWASERATQEWIGSGFDTDQELLTVMKEGRLSETRVGEYLRQLRNRFAPECIADMLCLIRLHVELSIKAKGMLIMRKAGFSPPPDPSVEADFRELEYLQESIGRTGLIALRPIFHTNSRDLWKLYMLRQESAPARRQQRAAQ